MVSNQINHSCSVLLGDKASFRVISTSWLKQSYTLLKSIKSVTLNAFLPHSLYILSVLCISPSIFFFYSIASQTAFIPAEVQYSHSIFWPSSALQYLSQLYLRPINSLVVLPMHISCSTARQFWSLVPFIVSQRNISLGSNIIGQP